MRPTRAFNGEGVCHSCCLYGCSYPSLKMWQKWMELGFWSNSRQNTWLAYRSFCPWDDEKIFNAKLSLCGLS